MRRLLPVLLLVVLCTSAWAADKVGNFGSGMLLSVVNDSGTNSSDWVYSGDLETLFCEFDVTALTGTSIQFNLQMCKDPTTGCTDAEDQSRMTAVTGVQNDVYIWIRDSSVGTCLGLTGDVCDEHKEHPLFPIWRVQVTHTAALADYTAECQWW